MFAKLYSRITESSLMEETIETRYVFLGLLAIADPQGYIIGTDVAVARRINVPLDTFTAAMVRLTSPDPNSNSRLEDGRRLVPSDGERGYKLVNYLTYRNLKDEDQRREYMKGYMRQYRSGKQPVNPVSSVNSGKLPLAQAEATA